MVPSLNPNTEAQVTVRGRERISVADAQDQTGSVGRPEPQRPDEKNGHLADAPAAPSG